MTFAKILLPFIVLCGLLVAGPGVPQAQAEPAAAGDHVARIYLLDQQGNKTDIGQVSFAGWTDGQTAISVEIDSPAFSSQFLSMRPFRCLESAREWFCYLEYPYPLKNIISRTDLRDLSYRLLFLRKKPAEFGIDAWNGLYYQLSIDNNNVITGVLLEGDLNSLASPPDEPWARPIDLDEFVPADANRLYPRILIQ